MKTVAIVIGHGPRDPGAVSVDGKETELKWNTDLARRMVAAIGDQAKAIIVHRVREKVAPVAQTNATGADLAIELHLNAFNRLASGTEMLYWHKSVKSRALAQVLQNAAVSVLGLQNRGLKARAPGGLGAPFLRDTRMPAVIVESFFIDVKEDLARGNERKTVLAAAYADALVGFMR